MPIKIHLSGYLKPFSGGKTEIALAGEYATVGDVLEALWERHIALRDRILTETGHIRQHVNIFVGSDDVKRLKGLQTDLTGKDLHIFNAVSGG
jgi:molybdopterin converting factor small subunit